MVHGNIISFLILVVSSFLFSFVLILTVKLVGGIVFDNILFFFMLFYIIFAYIGSVLLNVSFFSGGIRYLVYERKDLLLQVFFIISFGLLFIPCFVSILLKALGTNVKMPAYSSNEKDTLIEKVVFILIFGICIFVLYLYQKKAGGIALINYLKNPSLSQTILRSNATNNFQGHAWRYTLFYKTIPFTMMILVSFSSFKHLRNWLIIYNVFISVMNFEKAPLINLLIVLFIIYCRKKGKTNFKRLFLLILVGSVLIVLMYSIFMNSRGDVFSILNGALNRVFIVQIACFPWYFIYAEKYGFINGHSFPNPSGILPFEHNRITFNIMNLYNESSGTVTNGAVGSMPTVFPAEWYVNFGWIGIITSFILFCFIMVFAIVFSKKQMRKYHDKYSEAIHVYLIYYISNFSTGSFTGIIMDEKLIIPIALILLLRIMKNSCRIKPFMYNNTI